MGEIVTKKKDKIDILTEKIDDLNNNMNNMLDIMNCLIEETEPQTSSPPKSRKTNDSTDVMYR